VVNKDDHITVNR